MSLLPQIGMTELIVLGILALVIVGPKDLPKLMKAVGGFLRQARQLADEFRAGFDQMARESEMADLRQEIESLKRNNPVNEVKSALEDTARRAERHAAPAKPGNAAARQAPPEQDQPANAASPVGDGAQRRAQAGDQADARAEDRLDDQSDDHPEEHSGGTPQGNREGGA